MDLIEFLSQPWPWYVSGPMIALVMFLLLFSGERFGISSNLRSLCAIGGAGKRIEFFDFDWKSELWNLVFILGSILGGYIASTFLASPEPLRLSMDTIKDLEEIHVVFDGDLAPTALFNWESLSTWPGFVVLVIGGFLVGFGARYAGGCTSGHAISGLANFQLPSLIAVVGFFLGGLIMTHYIFPLLFS